MCIRVVAVKKFKLSNLKNFLKYKFVKDVRTLGAIAVIEIKYISHKRRLWLRKKIDDIEIDIIDLQKSIFHIAEENVYTLIPGYTHMQRAQDAHAHTDEHTRTHTNTYSHSH